MSNDVNNRGKQLSGEVRLSLQDYHNLLESDVAVRQTQRQYIQAIKAVKEWLTFLREKGWFEEAVSEFHKQNDMMRITLDDRGKISMDLIEDEGKDA